MVKEKVISILIIITMVVVGPSNNRRKNTWRKNNKNNKLDFRIIWIKFYLSNIIWKFEKWSKKYVFNYFSFCDCKYNCRIRCLKFMDFLSKKINYFFFKNFFKISMMFFIEFLSIFTEEK